MDRQKTERKQVQRSRQRKLDKQMLLKHDRMSPESVMDIRERRRMKIIGVSLTALRINGRASAFLRWRLPFDPLLGRLLRRATALACKRWR